MDDDEVRDLIGMVDGHEDSPLLGAMLELSGDLRNQRRRDRIIQAALLAGVVVSLLLWVGQRDATDRINATRADARIAACQQDNVRIVQHNALADSLQTILDSINVPRPSTTPDQQAAAKKFFDDARAAVDKSRVAIRDCTPAALTAYYTTTTGPGG